MDSGRTYWRTSPNYVFRVQRNHSFCWLPPAPISPKAAYYERRMDFGGGVAGSVSEVQVWAPLLANCEILDKFVAF